MSKLKGYIQRIKKSDDGRAVVSNFAYLSLLQVASYLFPLITMPYLARVIGVEGFGKIAFASAIMTWVTTVTDWGFNYTATRDVAQHRDDVERVSTIFSNVFWARCILMLLSLVVLAVLVALIPLFRENALIIFVTFLLVPGQILFPEWFFQAIEKMQYITILNILIRLFFTAAVFVFIKSADDYVLQPLLNSLGYLISGVVALYLILHKWHYRLKTSSIRDIFITIKQSTDVFINNLMPNLYNSFSTILLGMVGGSIATGKLDAGGKFINLGQQFITIISRTFYPFLSRKSDKHSLYARLNIYVSLFASLILFIFAPLVITIFFTPEFKEAITVMRIMSISIFFIALNSIYGVNYLIINGYERQLRNITAISSIVGFILSFPLICYFDFIGAAITITITRGIMGVAVTCKAKMIERNNIPQ